MSVYRDAIIKSLHAVDCQRIYTTSSMINGKSSLKIISRKYYGNDFKGVFFE